MTPQGQVQVAAVLAGIIQESKKVSGRVRMQKLAYLLQQKGVRELSNVEFVYHHYGPYADDIAGVLASAVRNGVVMEKAESFDDEWQRYEYSLGPTGAEYSTMLSQESLPAIRAVVSASKDLYWRTLELAATALYLKQRDGDALHSALRRAIDLKPGCQGYEDQATRLLKNLELG